MDKFFIVKFDDYGCWFVGLPQKTTKNKNAIKTTFPRSY
jgi:hypothetical protein